MSGDLSDDPILFVGDRIFFFENGILFVENRKISELGPGRSPKCHESDDDDDDDDDDTIAMTMTMMMMMMMMMMMLTMMMTMT